MNIVLLTQNDPFYLSDSIEDLIKKINNNGKHKICNAIVTSASPFGKKKGFVRKIFKTFKIFGFRFFLYYSYQYIFRKYILRKSVIKILNKSEIPVWMLNSSINLKCNVKILKELKPDLVVIIAGNQIIKNNILEIPKYGVINAHSSLLPDYKGLMPTFWVLKNKEVETGVTIFKLTEGIDNGPIINRKKIKIYKEFSQSDLIKKSKIIANELIIEALELVKYPERFINNTGGSYYNFPTKKDVNEFYKNKKFF